MNARDAVLGAVRRALGDAPREHVPVSREYVNASHEPDRVSLFVERVADYRATVRTVAPSEVVDAITSTLAGRSVICPPDLPYPLEGAIIDAGHSAVDLDRIDAVVTTAAVGIARTGTIVLDHSAGQGRRALTLVPDLHICIVRAEQIVDDVPDAVAALDPHRPQTWISGPSATSDIELNRVEGVHGPRTLHVLLVG
jgi:L-lactate dehydrogenase complex protein LldG